MLYWVKFLLTILASALVLGLVGAFFGELGLVVVVLLISLGAASFVVISVWALISGAPYVPIAPEHVAQVMDAAHLQAGELVADLGSGDGRLVMAAGERGARGLGYEINPYLWALSRYLCWRRGLGDRVELRLGSYWDQSLDGVDVVTLFLITGRMQRMSLKLRRELRPGARVVSYGFRLSDWPGEERVFPNVYRYQQPG
jgi:hypothetical protein